MGRPARVLHGLPLSLSSELPMSQPAAGKRLCGRVQMCCTGCQKKPWLPQALLQVHEQAAGACLHECCTGCWQVTPGLLQGIEIHHPGSEHLLMASGCDAACLWPAKAAGQPDSARFCCRRVEGQPCACLHVCWALPCRANWGRGSSLPLASILVAHLQTFDLSVCYPMRSDLQTAACWSAQATAVGSQLWPYPV